MKGMRRHLVKITHKEVAEGVVLLSIHTGKSWYETEPISVSRAKSVIGDLVEMLTGMGQIVEYPSFGIDDESGQSSPKG